MTVRLRIYVEGSTDIPVVRRIAQLVGVEPARILSMGGSSKLDPELPKLLKSAKRHDPVFVLRDVDPTPPNRKGLRFSQCPSKVLAQLKMPSGAPGFCLRLATAQASTNASSDWKHSYRTAAVTKQALTTT